MDNLAVVLVAVFGSSWFGGIVKDWIDDRRKKKRPCDRMILALGRRELLADAKRYVKQKGIPEDDYEPFKEEYDAYIAMGGNSKVKKWCEEALKLPIIYDED